jgi:Bacterial Ig-like domain (group 3)
MKLRSLLPSTSPIASTRIRFLVEVLLLLAATVCAVQTGIAQSPSQDQSRNVGYVHPPENAPALKLNKDPLHPAPQPYSAPKVPFRKGAATSLPRHISPEMYKENPDNLLRNWKNRRPMSEVKKAIQESLAMPSEPRRDTATRSNAVPTPGVQPPLSTTGWEQIGYGDYNTDNVHHQAGRIRASSYAYDNSQGLTTLWLGATGGGVWRSVDLLFAVAFVPVSDTLPGSPSVGAFLVQPGNSNNILIGTGDIYRYGGTGMYKTTDGGTTWNPVYPTDGTSWPDQFQKVLIDLNDSSNNTVLAEGNGGIWRSTDFGSTWSQVYSGQVTDLVQDPVNNYIWYAGAPGTGVLRSTSYGKSFGPIGTGMATPGRISVAVSAAAPWHVYAISATPDWKYLSGIWRSDDYGDGTWTQIESTDKISGQAQAFHTTTINVDPTNADLVIAGMTGEEITNNGTAATPTWTYSNTFDDGHADHTSYTFESGTNNIIEGTDGGVYVLDKTTLSISGALNYSTNLNVQQVFNVVGDLACSLNTPDDCISGLQDNGTVTINRNNTPPIVIVGGGDGNSASIAPDNDNEQFQMGDGGRWYTTDHWSTNVGDYGNCLINDFYIRTEIDQTPPNGFTPYIYTAARPTSGGSGGTSSYVWYKTVNPNCDWQAANATDPFDTSSFSPRDMDASNDPSGYVFYVVAWGTGRLNVLDSYSTGSLGTMTYVDRTPPLSPFASNNDAQVAADRSSSRPYTVTYVTGGARPSQAFISNDRGQTWTEVTGDLASKLPNVSYWHLIANPGDQRQLFLATDQGIYRSDNGGTNWYRYMNGMPAVADIFGLELNYDYASPPLLHLGTYGRGFWDRQLAPDAVLSKVTFIPTSVVGGQGAEVVVWLDRPAPQDITVNLTSSNPSVYNPSSTITVSQGYSNAGLIFNTAAVTSNTVVTVTGSYNDVSASANLTVTLAPTATSVASSLNPSTYGRTVTFTATVTSSYGTPTGTVYFYNGATHIGSGTLSGGHASFATSGLSAGSHSITAKYFHTGTFGGSTSSALSQVVNKASSATSLTSSLNPSTYGQSVTFTATVSSSTTTPTGSVTFKNGATTLGSGTLSGGHATYTTKTLGAGSHSITAVYAGNSNVNGSTSAALTQTVHKANSTTSLTATPNPSQFNQAVTLKATVKSATSGTPTGTVTFKAGTTILGTAALSSGVASLSVKTLTVGTHSITAVYGGSTNFNTSTSAVVSQVVKKANTTTTLTSSLNPSHHGNAVTFTATITPAFGGATTGTVNFEDGTKVIGTATVNTTTHKATLTTSTLSVGTHPIKAVFSGSSTLNGSSSAVLNQVVNP